ncbi:Cysteine-rich motor neuron 1 protein [Gryllus bimaculatus]|nr:Cysteine-rich motor neuron 1 protein [Gryllus bimaculatus]
MSYAPHCPRPKSKPRSNGRAPVAESGRNCSGAACLSLDDDEPPCPPDSVLVTPPPPSLSPSPTPTASPSFSPPASPASSLASAAQSTSPAPAAAAATGECACAPGRCVTPVCRNGSRRELKQRGSGVPGDCCDVYECVPPREKNCSEVVCPTESGACPSDSFRLPGRRGPRDCCSVPQGCQCLPRACAPPRACPAGAAPRRTRAATAPRRLLARPTTPARHPRPDSADAPPASCN